MMNKLPISYYKGCLKKCNKEFQNTYEKTGMKLLQKTLIGNLLIDNQSLKAGQHKSCYRFPKIAYLP